MLDFPPDQNYLVHTPLVYSTSEETRFACGTATMSGLAHCQRTLLCVVVITKSLNMSGHAQPGYVVIHVNLAQLPCNLAVSLLP